MEVFSQLGGGGLRPPVEGEVQRGEAFREVPGRVLGSEGGEGGEGQRESRHHAVCIRGGQVILKAAERPSYLQ